MEFYESAGGGWWLYLSLTKTVIYLTTVDVGVINTMASYRSPLNHRFLLILLSKYISMLGIRKSLFTSIYIKIK